MNFISSIREDRESNDGDPEKTYQGNLPEATVSAHPMTPIEKSLTRSIRSFQGAGLFVDNVPSYHLNDPGAASDIMEAMFTVAQLPLLLEGGLPRLLSKGGGKVFWSGGEMAKNAAATFAKSNGMKTLEMTSHGRIMESVGSFLPRSISNPLWNRLSSNFADGATGSVHVFHNATNGVRLNSIWSSVEYPILNKNGVEMIFHNVYK